MGDIIRLLDLGCSAGGTSWGYHLAGQDSAARGGPVVEVTGVDIAPQPRFPWPSRFIRADATTLDLDGYDAYACSMPCHDHTPLKSVAGLDGTGHLLGDLRTRLEATGKPYVIENVPGAPMRADVRLCGCMQDPPLRTYRLRWFEASAHFGPGEVTQLPHRDHSARTATKQRRKLWDEGWHVSITGDVGTYLGPEAMGIDWMSGNELSLAVPPAYTRYVGRFLIGAVLREREKSLSVELSRSFLPSLTAGIKLSVTLREKTRRSPVPLVSWQDIPVCCYTHDLPVAAAYGGQLAEHESLRCRCGTGAARCVRRATEEDLLCDRCRADEPDFYSAGVVPGFLEAPSPFRVPLRYERGLVQNYRIGLTVAQPSAMFIISGLG